MSDYRTTSGEPLPEGRRERKNRHKTWLRRGLLAALLLTGAGFRIRVPVKILASGYVTSDDYAEVRPAVSGPIAEIRARSGALVAEGDMLARLEDQTQQAELEQARNTAERTRALLTRRAAEIAEERRERKHLASQSSLRAAHAEQAYAMTEELHERGLASGRALEEARTSRALALAERDRLLEEDEDRFNKELEVLRREIAVAESAVMRAEAQLQARHILAPIAGQVVRYEFVTGELVTPEMALYEIYGGTNLVMKLRVPERYATQVEPGAPYKATLSIYRGIGRKKFYGQITALRSVIQSDGTRTYRMAYADFDDEGVAVPPGTSAEARIIVGYTPFWWWLFGVR